MSLVPETPIEWYARKKLEDDSDEEFFIDVHIKYKLTETDFQNLCVLIYDHLYDLYGESDIGDSLDGIIFSAVKDEEFINILNVEIADKLFCDVHQELLASPEEYFSGRDFAKTKKYKEILSYAKRLEDKGDTKMSYDDLMFGNDNKPELGKITGPKGGWTNQHTAYIPTVFIAPPELNVDEVWYVKFSGSNCLMEQKIIDVTEKTVLLETFDADYFCKPTRYKKTDIEFVEKVK